MVANLTWSEVEQRLSTGVTPVFTVGASAKEHGQHLPLDTDLRQAEWLGNAVAARWSTLVWPAIGYGYYPAFMQYPGSTSISSETFVTTLTELIASINLHTQTTPVIVNTGISTIKPLEKIADKAKLIHAYRGHHFAECSARLCQQRAGGHADEAETSIMLAIAPDVVQAVAAVPWDYAFEVGPISRRREQPNFSPDGICGRPDLASAQVGHELLQAILADLHTTFTASA
jgi:creatinine amidohydrolase